MRVQKAPTSPREGQFRGRVVNVANWRDRAGRRIGSNCAAMERPTSQPGGFLPFVSSTATSTERQQQPFDAIIGE
jgi:hypothetical protein